MQMRKTMRGITLIELLIVVVIIGILTAIAFPNYREYMARSKRSEAKAALLKAAVNQEKWYLQNQIFSDDLAELGFGSPFKTDSGTYTLTVSPSPPSASTFTVTATNTGGDEEEKSKCLTLTIDVNGIKTSGPQTDCWTRRN